MGMDDSFKKQGAVPFKWEIKPGVPKQQHHHIDQANYSSTSWEIPSLKLKPPPSTPHVFSSGEPWTRSFQSTTPVRSELLRSDRPLVRSNSMPSGCFFSPLLKRLPRWKVNRKPMVESEYASEFETHSVWSTSNQFSVTSHAGWDGSGRLV